MDTDRDRDIAFLEVQEENRKLVEEYYREKLGKRGMTNENNRGTAVQGETSGAAGNESGGAAGLPPAQV